MKVCPKCGMPQIKPAQSCQFCNYTEKPLTELSKKQISDLMSSYDYEKVGEGEIRIISVKNIRDIALRGYIAVPHFVTEIADGAFANCKFLSKVELPRQLRFIGDNAFANCRDLYNAFIPETVTHMGKGVFADCYDLRTVYCAAYEKPEGWDGDWLDGCKADVLWSCPDEA